MSEFDGRVDDADMAMLLNRMNNDASDGIAAIDALLIRYADDARLHFLRGSIFAGSGRPLEAHRSLSKAVSLDPDFDIARFQLGFFELTSGEADAALQTWLPLDRLADGHYLRQFVDGLRALIADRFSDCIALLQSGIALNRDNLPLNKDMELIIATFRELAGKDSGPSPVPDDAVSETALLLGRFGPSSTRN